MADNVPLVPSRPLPSTPATTAPNLRSPDPRTAISAQIDALLESYLTLLDTYTSLRASLSKELSAGFFSLAQAQRSSTLGAGRRYGEECYDQRMQAQRVVTIGVDFEQRDRAGEEDEEEEDVIETEGVAEFTVKRVEQTKPQPVPQTSDISPLFKNSTPSLKILEEPSPKEPKRADPNTLPNPSQKATATAPSNTTRTTTSPPKKTPNTDPLRWFGILTPPALRQCQTAFRSSVTGPIPALVNTSNRMLAIEEEICNLRKQLDGELSNSESQVEEHERTEGGISIKTTTDSQTHPISSPSRKSKSKSKTAIPSQTSELRSRILKID